MKIGITGTHNVGKTSLAYSLVGALKEKGFHAIGASETVRMCPLPTGTEKANSVEAESWILGKQFIDEIELESKYDVVVCDRSVLCIYAYFLWNLEREPHKKELPMAQIANKLFEEWVKTYDFIFKLPISEQTRLVDDGFRSTQQSWQKEIDDILDKIIEKYNLKVISIPLDKNERRVAKILETVLPSLEKLKGNS